MKHRVRLYVEALEERCLLSLPNGVAAGDTTHNTTVLWAHSTTPGQVLFEYANNPQFDPLLGQRSATVTDPAQPVKAPVQGLTPGTQYYYRARDADGASAQGQFRTPAAPGAFAGLHFGVAGDFMGQLSPYPALRGAAQRGLDFLVELGDTAYTDIPTPALNREARTLAEFRAKHNEVYATRFGVNHWTPLRGSTSVLASIDDHEVRNDFAGGAHPSTDPRFQPSTAAFINETPLYAMSLQTFQEYNPLRDDTYGDTGDPRTALKRKLFRAGRHGNDAAVFVLDSRSFRDASLPGIANLNDPAEVATFLAASFNPARTMLGRAQLLELKEGLLRAEQDGVTWKFVQTPSPMQELYLGSAHDIWPGYAAERNDLLRFIDENHIRNVVFVAADHHLMSVNNLTYQTEAFGPQHPTGAFEVIVPALAAVSPSLGFVGLYALRGFIGFGDVFNYLFWPRPVQDDFVRTLLDIDLSLWGFDPIGLDNSGIPAALLQGGWFGTHNFGWTEFEVDAATQLLTVTTWAVPVYNVFQLQFNPDRVLNQEPFVLSQFVVAPRRGGGPGRGAGQEGKANMDTKAPLNPDFEAVVRDSFARQQFMATIGAQLTRVSPGEVEITLPYRADLTQQNGFLHAGIVTSLVDSACGYAAYSLMPANTDVLTVEFKMNLVAPAVGPRVVARGRVLKAGRTLTVTAGDAWSVDGTEERLVATMLATMIVRPAQET